MNDTNFFSSNTYLPLPTSSNPKVMLAIDSSLLSKNAFKLYNPFSKKAIYLKNFSSFLLSNFNFVFKNVLPIKTYQKGYFIKHLENKLALNLVSSVYYATAGDKVVLQLQTEQKIIGYIKYPINEIGIKRIENEKKAIELFAKKGIVDSYILYGHFNSTPYLYLKELKGTIEHVTHLQLVSLLENLKKKNKFLLKNHPRILQLIMQLKQFNLFEELAIIKKICETSTVKYSEVYEHGDFAPWNLITHNNKVTPFDFEYFEETGLEFLDLIKYYYQIALLLKGTSEKEMFNFIYKKIKHDEIEILLQVFLIKEISKKKTKKELFTFEKKILNIITDASC
tara:strand:- start:344 stop:1357 length:1014 start_codon:yes stop_codon:yes gene_type:complete